MDGNDIASAARMRWEDFEDCLVYLCAQKVKADYLVTRDKAGFASAKAPVLTPEELLQKVEEEGLTYDEVELGESTALPAMSSNASLPQAHFGL